MVQDAIGLASEGTTCSDITIAIHRPGIESVDRDGPVNTATPVLCLLLLVVIIVILVYFMLLCYYTDAIRVANSSGIVWQQPTTLAGHQELLLSTVKRRKLS